MILLLAGALTPATAGPSSTRADVQAVLGGGQTLEDFESFAIAAGEQVNIDCATLDEAAVCNGQGPGLVEGGIAISFGLSSGNWLGPGGFDGGPSKDVSSSSQPLTVDFIAPVQAFGVDVRNSALFAAEASVDIYGADDTTLLASISAIDLSSGDPVFIGWVDLGGIGKVEFRQTQPWSPAIDNLEFGLAANADTEQLVSRDDATHGLDSITIDTQSGLEWLDLTKSTNLSADVVATQLGVGGDFDGFRYASIAELTELFGHAGIPDVSFGPGAQTGPNFAPVSNLLSLLGVTAPAGGFSQSSGLLADPSPFVPANRAVGILQADSNTNTGSADPVQASAPASSQFEIVGSFLVRAVSMDSLNTILDGLSAEGADAVLEAVADQVARQIDRGNEAAAMQLLTVFIARVERLADRGKLSEEDAATLAAVATALKDQM